MANKKGLAVFGLPWHVSHQHSLAKLSFIDHYDLVYNPYRTWGTSHRPFPKKCRWVTHFRKNYYDFAILHADQQSIFDLEKGDRIHKGKLYMDLKRVIGDDCPIVTINHMTPFHDKYDSPYVIDFIKKMTKGTFMITNSHEAAKQWGWGHPVIHGMDVDEWWDLPKEPRCITVLSPAGMERAYRRVFLTTVQRKLSEMGVPFAWVGVDMKCDSFDEYRDYLGRSLVFFMPTWQSPRPRARTEAMLCLKKGSKVISGADFSYINIENVKPSDIVLDKDGYRIRVLKTYKERKKLDMIDLEVCGHEKISCSSRHKLLAVKTSKFVGENDAFSKPFSKDKYIREQFDSLDLEWIKAENLKKNDCIVSPAVFDRRSYDYLSLWSLNHDSLDKRGGYIRWKGSFNNLESVCKEFGISYDYARERLRTKRYVGEKINRFVSWLREGNYTKIGYLKGRIRITGKFARLLGYYIAEGHTNGSSIFFSFHAKEDEYHRDVLELMEFVFGIKGKLLFRSNNRCDVRFESKLVGFILEKLCGKGAKNKIIPQELLFGRKDIVINLLAGLYRGDGHIGNEVSYCTISSKLAYQVYFLLKLLSIHGTVTFSKVRERMRFPRYSIRSYGSYARVLRSIACDLKIKKLNHKKHSYFKYHDHWYYPVKKVKKYKSDEIVYDLTVEGGNYLVNGLITHNSGACVVSTPYQDADTFIKHGVNGFLTSRAVVKDPRVMDNPEAAARLIKRLVIDEPDLALRIGQEGKKMARKLFSFDKFEAQWREVLVKIKVL